MEVDMEIKIKNKRTVVLMITFAILLHWGLNHLSMLPGIVSYLVGILFPFLLGGAIAFILNVPVKNIERMIGPAFKEKKMLLRAVSITLSFLLTLGIVAFVVIMVIPELVDTLGQLNKGIPGFLDNTINWLLKVTKNYPEVTKYLMSIELNWSELTHKALVFLQESVEIGRAHV